MKKKNDKKNVFFAVRLDDQTAKFIEEQSKKKGIDRSKVVRELLNNAAKNCFAT